MTRDDLLKHLKDRMGVEVDDLEDETLIFSSGILDSFSMVDLMLFIEGQTKTKMRPADVTLDNLDSVERILAYASRCANDRSA